MKARYPGDHMSTNPCVQTPGMPYFVICDISKLAIAGSSPYKIGSRFGFCGGWPLNV